MMLYSDMKEGIVSKEDYVELHAAYGKRLKMRKRVSVRSRKKWIVSWKSRQCQYLAGLFCEISRY